MLDSGFDEEKWNTLKFWESSSLQENILFPFVLGNGFIVCMGLFKPRSYRENAFCMIKCNNNSFKTQVNC